MRLIITISLIVFLSAPAFAGKEERSLFFNASRNRIVSSIISMRIPDFGGANHKYHKKYAKIFFKGNGKEREKIQIALKKQSGNIICTFKEVGPNVIVMKLLYKENNMEKIFIWEKDIFGFFKITKRK